MEFLIIIVIIVFLGFLKQQSHKRKYLSSYSGQQMLHSIGKELAGFMYAILHQDETLWKTKEEKKEILYFLIYEIHRLVYNKFANDSDIREKILSGFDEAVFIDEEGLNYRKKLYSKCKSLINKKNTSSSGTSLLVLSHFLKIARGGTTKKDITNILVGKAEIGENDLDQFLDGPEYIILSSQILNILLTLKKALNILCKNI